MPFRGSLGVGVLRGGEANQFGRILGGGGGGGSSLLDGRNGGGCG